MDEERRKHIRYPATIPAVVKRRGASERLETLDVSHGGIFVLTDSPRPARELLHVVFELPMGIQVEAMCMVARVVSASESWGMRPGMGLNIFSQAREAAQLWHSFVESCRTKAASAAAAAMAPPAEPVEVPAPPAGPPPLRPPFHPRVAAPAETAAPAPVAPAAAPPVAVAAPPVAVPVPAAPPPVEVVVRWGDGTLRCRVREISVGGVFVFMPSPPAAGTELDLMLVNLGPHRGELVARGSVVRTSVGATPEENGAVLRFLGPPEEVRANVRRFLQGDAPQPPPFHPAPATPAFVTAAPVVPALVEPLPSELVESSEELCALGLNYLAHDDVVSALPLLHKTLQKDPANITAHRGLHRIYIRLRDVHRAASHLRVAMALERLSMEDLAGTEEPQ